MYSRKLETLLVVSLESDDRALSESDELSVGVDKENDRWELVVKYYADSEDEFRSYIEENYEDTSVYPLLCNYCVIITIRSNINRLAMEACIQYIEKPKILYQNLINEKRESCIRTGITQSMQLSGFSVIVGIIDTGIDISDRDFLKADGTTRIIRLWDQAADIVYDSDMINAAIRQRKDSGMAFTEVSDIFYDYSNHGINVCKIACGNNGVAWNADIIFVKLKRSDNGFTQTTDMMRAVDFCVRTAAKLRLPIAINISYGSNYGPHLQADIQTSYINDVCGVWKTCICVGSGNEAQAAIHAHVDVSAGISRTIELAVVNYETQLSLALWYSALDDIRASIVSPDGNIYEAPVEADILHDAILMNTSVAVFNGSAKPYSTSKEVYISLTPRESDYVAAGLWKIKVRGVNIKAGRIDAWLSAAASLNIGTGFVRPSSELTFTVPSTARNVITVGSYNSATLTPSSFSGRGYVYRTGSDIVVKPDLAAPGENVAVSDTTVVSGTSYAVPFVTGAAALLMEWGITMGNDPYMYGDRLKIKLHGSAKPFEGETQPNAVTGWGRLCVNVEA